jgi:hypothetical protein
VSSEAAVQESLGRQPYARPTVTANRIDSR